MRAVILGTIERNPQLFLGALDDVAAELRDRAVTAREFRLQLFEEQRESVRGVREAYDAGRWDVIQTEARW